MFSNYILVLEKSENFFQTAIMREKDENNPAARVCILTHQGFAGDNEIIKFKMRKQLILIKARIN